MSKDIDTIDTYLLCLSWMGCMIKHNDPDTFCYNLLLLMQRKYNKHVLSTANDALSRQNKTYLSYPLYYQINGLLYIAYPPHRETKHCMASHTNSSKNRCISRSEYMIIFLAFVVKNNWINMITGKDQVLVNLKQQLITQCTLALLVIYLAKQKVELILSPTLLSIIIHDIFISEM